MRSRFPASAKKPKTSLRGFSIICFLSKVNSANFVLNLIQQVLNEGLFLSNIAAICDKMPMFLFAKTTKENLSNIL